MTARGSGDGDTPPTPRLLLLVPYFLVFATGEKVREAEEAGADHVGGDELVAGYPSYLLNLQVVISIFVAAQAPTLLSRDLRFRTITLYLARPMRRSVCPPAADGTPASACPTRAKCGAFWRTCWTMRPSSRAMA